ncbi:NFATC2-interacting -like [Brachionus plicatilis]|uniref:NFATC2-interacting-like n=1 Tax=Brachionus plicatilis TaxID=10195 RepID=A0A3M7SID8_BRAPC|nr:NFATC2-interacting -like [Brachionus plicatilis]
MSIHMERLDTTPSKKTAISDSSDCENRNQQDVNTEKNRCQKSTVRGNLAALVSNLDASDSDDSDTNFKPKTKAGLYARRLNQTKKERKNINHKFFKADKNLITDVEECSNKQNPTENQSDKMEIELSDSNDSDISNKKKKIEKEDSSDSELDVPPPPPKNTRRKSTSLLDKHFKELESFRVKTDNKILLNDSDRVACSSDDDELNTVTIRVSTKNGLKKWNINKNQSFSVVFENLAKIENTGVENLVLMVKDQIINLSDTPASINLKAYDIIDCGKTATINQEKVKIVEEGECFEHGSNMVTLILQTDTGRKSRVKFLVSVDEPFESILKKYCEKKELDMDKFSLQMEGDKIELTETPRDLDFEDDFMIDVVKSKKPVLQIINENKQNYEFDDDIIITLSTSNLMQTNGKCIKNNQRLIKKIFHLNSIIICFSYF